MSTRDSILDLDYLLSTSLEPKARTVLIEPSSSSWQGGRTRHATTDGLPYSSSTMMARDENRQSTLDKLIGAGGACSSANQKRIHSRATTDPTTTIDTTKAKNAMACAQNGLRTITLLDLRQSQSKPISASSAPNSPALLDDPLPLGTSSSSSNQTQRPPIQHRHTTSSPSFPSTHHTVRLPKGYVRSQPLGLNVRASNRAALADQGDFAPTPSGGVTTHRLSTSSSSSSISNLSDSSSGANRSPRRRKRPEHSGCGKADPWDSGYGLAKSTDSSTSVDLEKELRDLPPNPKLWLPSHLAAFLSSHLSLHPRLSSDITHFIKTSRLSGRTFLRLRDDDLEDMGINLRWRKALREAREKLRKEVIGGRIFWGFEGGSSETQPVGSHNQPITEREARRNFEDEGASVRMSQSSTSSASTARSQRVAGSSSGGSSSSRSESSSRPPSVGSGMPYLLSATSPTPPLSHNRRGSIDVEGHELDDEMIKEEWKQSWKRLVQLGGRGKVRGMASAFERVEEASTSRENSPVKSRKARTNSISDAEQGEERLSRIWVRGGDGLMTFNSLHGRSDSIDSNLSDASVDSGNGCLTQQMRDDDAATARPRQSRTESNRQNSGLITDVFANESMPNSYQAHIVLQPHPYDLVRRPSQTANPRASILSLAPAPPSNPNHPQMSTTAPLADASTIRGPSQTRLGENRTLPAFSSTANRSSRMTKEDKRKSLANLFDLEIPRAAPSSNPRESQVVIAKTSPPRMKDELVEWEIGATKGKRGSMVLIRRSQLEALSRRMDEVEEALAASIQGGSETACVTSTPLHRSSESPTRNPSVSSSSSTAALEALNLRLASIEHQLPAAGPGSPLPHSPDPQQDQQQPSTHWPYHSHPPLAPQTPSPTATIDAAMSSWITHQLTLSEIEASRLARRRDFEQVQRQEERERERDEVERRGRRRREADEERAMRGEGPLLSWGALGGYVVAASIGIGIVAGEVVAAKLFNVRPGAGQR